MNIKIDTSLENDVQELLYQSPGKSIPGMISEYQQKDDEWTPFFWIKKANLNPRVHTFIWRAFNNAIPTFHFLKHRKLKDNDLCPRCNAGKEDLEHIIGGCLKIKEVITIIKSWGFVLPDFNNIQDCCKWIHNIHKSKGMILNLFFNVMYYSWKARNKLIHEGYNESAISIAVQAISQISYSKIIFNQLPELWDVNQSPRLFNTWHPPPPGWLKINVDATLSSSYKAGVGGIIRDCKGRFLLAFGNTCIHWDIYQLELLAIKVLRNVIKDWMFKYK
ncbi:uncharacterized protein LOC110097315 [Dendrobium catenatum]|uniref:uncharacterized protein LOC110097315 n=1 Tax=Dendrobium catenatum TaxID=906689 RepID=UPI0010A094F2|nr:uncharacterized protein LOC110097315 [Dendrobium catenatum]